MQYTDHHSTCFILMLNQGSKLIVLKITTASAAHSQRRVIKRAKTFCEEMGSNGNLYHQTDNIIPTIIPTDESSWNSEQIKKIKYLCECMQSTTEIMHTVILWREGPLVVNLEHFGYAWLRKRKHYSDVIGIFFCRIQCFWAEDNIELHKSMHLPNKNLTSLFCDAILCVYCKIACRCEWKVWMCECVWALWWTGHLSRVLPYLQTKILE